MGYIAPAPPSFVTLPPDVSRANVEAFREVWERQAAYPQMWVHPRLGAGPPDFGLQWIGGTPEEADPRGFAERYTVHFGYGLLASIATLVLIVAWLAR